jgi:hypothetical protein
MGGNLVYPHGSWKTPLGEVLIDEEALELLGGVLGKSKKAHTHEHSLEVQVPFIQHARGSNDFKILPIIMGDQSLESAKALGQELAKLNCAFIASSDFSHYVPRELAHENDTYVIQAILDLDEHEIYERVRERNVTACGIGPIAAACAFAKKNRCIEGKLLDYSTSGDVTGDPVVVGYASIVFV